MHSGMRRLLGTVSTGRLPRPQAERIHYKIQYLLDVKAPLREHFLRYSTCPSSPCETKCPPGGGGGSKHQLLFKPYVEPCYKDHDHKNMELNRPMSPHLEIYGPTVPAMTSITQRATGTILSFYALMLSGGALFLPHGIDSIIYAIQGLDLSNTTIMAVKFVAGLPFAYHYFIGIRFVAWNMGTLLRMKQIYASAYAGIAAAFALAVLFAMR